MDGSAPSASPIVDGRACHRGGRSRNDLRSALVGGANQEVLAGAVEASFRGGVCMHGDLSKMVGHVDDSSDEEDYEDI